MRATYHVQHPQMELPTRICFVDANPNLKTKRARELQKQRALAHAAVVGHTRKKVRQGALQLFPPKEKSPQTQSMQSFLLEYDSRSSDALRGSSANEIDEENSERTIQSFRYVFANASGYEYADYPKGAFVDFDAYFTRPTKTVTNDLIITEPQRDFGSIDQFFLNVPRGDDEKVRIIIEFYAQALNPINDLATEVFDVTNVYALYMPMLSSCPIFFDAAMVIVGIVRSGLIKSDPWLSGMILQHVGEAMKNIRKQLGRDDWHVASQRQGLFASIIFLAHFEAYRGNLKVAQQHLRGISRAIDELGGLQSLSADDHFKERTLVMFFESAFAMTGNSKIFEKARRQWRPVYPPLPLDDSFLRVCKLLPKACQELMVTGQLSTDTIAIFSNAMSSNITQNTAAVRRARAGRRNKTRSYPDFIEACPVLLAPNTEATMLEKLLCYSLLLYSCVVFASARSITSFFRASRTQLNVLVRSYQPSSVLQRKCLLWALIVTAESQRSREVLVDEDLGLLDHFASRFPEMAFWEWKRVEACLFEFFWTTELSTFWARSWANVVQRSSKVSGETAIRKLG